MDRELSRSFGYRSLGEGQDSPRKVPVQHSFLSSHLRQGLPRIPEVMEVVESDAYKAMQVYSRSFLGAARTSLKNYRWTKDALSHWSRIYEYPYSFCHLVTSLKAGCSVLDAGSGVTFFPFFIGSMFQVTCVDRDDYSSQYSVLGAGQRLDIAFVRADLRQLPFPESSYDAIYCISVLEHTNEYEAILREFRRILRPGGLLIVTFDVSLDGHPYGIDPHKAGDLIRAIGELFNSNYDEAKFIFDLSLEDLYTTSYVKQWNSRLLPWPRRSFMRRLRRFLSGRTLINFWLLEMTFCCVFATRRQEGKPASRLAW